VGEPLQIKPVTLIGKYVQLAPLEERHIAGLAAVGLDERIWEFMRYGRIETEADLRQWVLEILEHQKVGQDLPFVVLDRASGNPVGATRYMDIHPQNRNLEIGGTWYGLAYQHTAVNTETKYLLLEHAFERLGCLRVFFKTDVRNERSQKAIERLGAVKEGVMRNHMILPNGFVRSSVFYSILVEEWPLVKWKLANRLGY
jgi:RimJ/RimL family protein N-acetyltransferase